MKAVARLGDTSDHGGIIISASHNLNGNSTGIARQGDMHSCPIRHHGTTLLTSVTVVGGSKPLITVGAVAGCGAVIITGSPSIFAE